MGRRASCWAESAERVWLQENNSVRGSARTINVNVWILLHWKIQNKSLKQKHKTSTGLNVLYISKHIKSATWTAFLLAILRLTHTCSLSYLKQVAVDHFSTCFLSMPVRLIWNVSVTEKLFPVKHLQSSVLMVNRTSCLQKQETPSVRPLRPEAVNHCDITYRRLLIPPSTAVNQRGHLHLCSLIAFVNGTNYLAASHESCDTWIKTPLHLQCKLHLFTVSLICWSLMYETCSRFRIRAWTFLQFLSFVNISTSECKRASSVHITLWNKVNVNQIVQTLSRWPIRCVQCSNLHVLLHTINTHLTAPSIQPVSESCILVKPSTLAELKMSGSVCSPRYTNK